MDWNPTGTWKGRGNPEGQPPKNVASHIWHPGQAEKNRCPAPQIMLDSIPSSGRNTGQSPRLPSGLSQARQNSCSCSSFVRNCPESAPLRTNRRAAELSSTTASSLCLGKGQESFHRTDGQARPWTAASVSSNNPGLVWPWPGMPQSLSFLICGMGSECLVYLLLLLLSRFSCVRLCATP